MTLAAVNAESNVHGKRGRRKAAVERPCRGGGNEWGVAQAACGLPLCGCAGGTTHTWAP